MSRIGKQIVEIPAKTEVSVSGNLVVVKGPKGELSRTIHPGIKIDVADNKVSFAPTKDTVENRALWGTYASHVINMIKGVTTLFEKKLIIEGVGFKWEVSGESINMSLGFSHNVKVPIPSGITVTTVKNNMTIAGIDKEAVGQFAAYIRALKKPEPYKGKGIRYEDEVLKRKEGKKSV